MQASCNVGILAGWRRHAGAVEAEADDAIAAIAEDGWMDGWMDEMDRGWIILEKRIEGLQGSAQIMGITYFHCQEFKSRNFKIHIYRRTRQQ